MSVPPSSSRLAFARRRARTLKLISGGAALAAFGVVSVLARDSHGGAAKATANGGGLSTSSRIEQEAQQSNSFFDPGSVTPAPAREPQASTHTS